MNTIINQIIEKHLGERAEPLFKEIGFNLPESVILESVKDNQYLVTESPEDVFNVFQIIENSTGKIELCCKEVIDNELYLIYRQYCLTRIVDSFTAYDPRIQLNLEDEGFHYEEAIVNYLTENNLVPKFSKFVYDYYDSYKEIDYQETDKVVSSWYFVSPQLATILANYGEITLCLGNSYLWGRSGSGYTINQEEFWSSVPKLAKILSINLF